MVVNPGARNDAFAREQASPTVQDQPRPVRYDGD